MEKILDYEQEVFIGKGGNFNKSLFPVGKKHENSLSCQNICKPFILVIEVR